ncbi:MAG: DNA recombination protein RmuC [Flavobacteriaceae bacterium]|nr:DNA recombination protein RmuC [Flavobacteriaceae bacterium]
MDIVFYILGFAVLLALGYFLGMYKTKSALSKDNAALQSVNAMLQEDKTKAEKQLEDKASANSTLQMALTQKETELGFLNKKLAEQKADLEKLQEKFTKEFENLANKILDEKSAKFTKQNKENLAVILEPLKQKIQDFEKRVETSDKESIRYHTELRAQIIGLEKLNQKMSSDAVNLTKALKGDSKTQGDWGELQLEVLLEKSGLQKGVHFTTQGGYRDGNNQLKKPDCIINLPDNKHLIIDSKVSLTAYEQFFSAEGEVAKKTAIKNHILSIKKHFKELSDKNYTDLYGINTPDYVLMFVPIEPALMVALQEDSKLYLEALGKNVVLVSTSTLLATLSTIASIWKQEDQKRNVLEIAKESGLLYDKFEGFVQDLIKVGKAINTSQDSYQAAMNKLSTGRGNMISKIENLKKLGAKTKKSLPDKLLERASE